MSLRTPGAQIRNQYGRDWGNYATALVLPNTFGFVAPANKIAPLEIGDRAYVTGTSELFVCTATGVTGPIPDGLAVWTAVGTAVAGQDRFAPTFLIGNTAAGDSAIAYSTAGFQYFPDIGDGSQLAIAMGIAGILGGRVYIRRGLYNLGLITSPLGPIGIPVGVTVQGEGSATVIRAAPTLNQGVFSMGAATTLTDIFLESDASDAGSLGSDALLLTLDNVTLRDVGISMVTAPGGQLQEAIRFTWTPGVVRAAEVERVNINALATGATFGIRMASAARINARNLEITGSDVAIQNDGATFTVDELYCLFFEAAGIKHSAAGGSNIVSKAFLAVSTTAVSAVPLGLQGSSGSSFRDANIFLAPGAAQQPVAINYSLAAVGLGAATFDNVAIGVGFGAGIQLGTTGGVGTVRGVVIRGCTIEAGGTGLLVAESSSSCHIEGNTIRVAGGISGVVNAGIDFEGGVSFENVVEGNTVDVTDGLNAAYGIRLRTQQSTCTGNAVTVNDGLRGIDVAGERTTTTGNTLNVTGDGSAGCIHVGPVLHCITGNNLCRFSTTVYVAPAILIDGERGTVGDNVTIVTLTTPGASPGITLSPTSMNVSCANNVCDGSTGLAVSNLNASNNVVGNIAI